MDKPAGIWAIRYHNYDGCGYSDEQLVRLEWEYETAEAYLDEQNKELEDFSWEHWDSLDSLVLVSRTGRYGYEYYIIEFMPIGEDIY